MTEHQMAEFERRLTVTLDELAAEPATELLDRIMTTVRATPQRSSRWALLGRSPGFGGWWRVIATGTVVAAAIVLGITIGASGILPIGIQPSISPQPSATTAPSSNTPSPGPSSASASPSPMPSLAPSPVAGQIGTLPPSANGWIAFCGTLEAPPPVPDPNSGAPRLYAMRPDGSALTELHPAPCQEAKWSPGGTQLAFVQYASGPQIPNSALAILEQDGTLRTFDLPEGSAEVSDPAWSPDGARISAMVWPAHETMCDGCPGQLMVLNVADGSWQPVELSGESYSGVTWSVTGRVAYLREPTSIDDPLLGGYYSALPDGSDLQPLLLDEQKLGSFGGHPRWSPDGDKLLILLPSDTSTIYGQGGPCNRAATLNADGSGLAWVSPPQLCVGEPIWSPDGQQIAFATLTVARVPLAPNPDLTLPFHLYTMNVDGSDLREVPGIAPWEHAGWDWGRAPAG